MSKQFDTSASADELRRRMANRYTKPDREPAAPTPPKPNKPTAPAMTTRSWYLSVEVADQLATTADRLWRGAAPGVSKREVLEALITAGLNQADEVSSQLSQK